MTNEHGETFTLENSIHHRGDGNTTAWMKDTL
jgi:hypothetical protein